MVVSMYGTIHRLPVTPVNTLEKSEIVQKIEINGKEVRIILNALIEGELYVYDAVGKRLHSYTLKGKEIVFKLQKRGIYMN